MKRIYSILTLLTLLVGGYFSSPALATTLPGVKGQLEDYKLSPEAQRVIHARQTNPQLAQANGMKKVMKKTYEEGDMAWEISLYQNSQNWCDVLIYSDGSHVSFSDLPYYWVYYTIKGTSKNSGELTTNLQIPLLWPSKYIWGEQWIDDNAGLLSDDEKDFEIVSPEEMFNAPANRGRSFLYSGSNYAYYGDDTNSWLGYFPIAPNAWYGGEGWPMYYNGVTTYLYDNDSSRYSMIVLESMDTESKDCQTANKLYFKNGTELNLTYNGESSTTGFGNDYQCIYLIGDPQGWNVQECGDEWKLYKTNEGGRIYERALTLPAGETRFRFYGRLGNWEKYSIGAGPYDAEYYEFDLNSGSFTSEIWEWEDSNIPCKGNWVTHLDNPTLVKMRVDLDKKEVSFTAIDTNPETLYMYFYQTLGNNAREVLAMDKATDGIYTVEVTRDQLYNSYFQFSDSPLKEDRHFTIGSSSYNFAENNYGAYENDGSKADKKVKLDNVSFNGFPYYLTNLAQFEKATVEVNVNTMEITISNIDWSFNPDDYSVEIIGLDQEVLFSKVNYLFVVKVPSGQGELVYNCNNANVGIWNCYYNEDGTKSYIVKVEPYPTEEITLEVSTEDAFDAGLYEVIRKRVVDENFEDYDIQGLIAILEDGSRIDFEKNESGWFTKKMTIPANSTFSLEILCSNGETKPLGNIYAGLYCEYHPEDYTLELFQLVPDGSIKLTTAFSTKFVYHGDEDAVVDMFFNIGRKNLIIRDTSENPVFNFVKDSYEIETLDDWNEFVVEVTSDEEYPEYTRNITDVTGDIDIEDIYDAGYDYNYEDKTFKKYFVIRTYGTGEFTLTLTRYDGLSTTAHIKVNKVELNGIQTSLDRIELREGEFVKLVTQSLPVAGGDIDGYCYDYSIARSMDNGTEFYILGLEPGETVMHLYIYQHDNITKDIPVIILPKDAVVAEHVAYAYMQPGETRKHYVSSHQNGTEASPTWSSSDTSVARVDEDGNVTAIANGRAILTADCGDHTTYVGIHVDNETSVAEVARRVSVYTTGTTVVVAGAEDGEDIVVLDVDGKLAAKRSVNGTTRINIERNGAFIVTVGNETFKVVL